MSAAEMERGNGNGSHVTWRELNLVLEPMQRDLGEIKDDVKVLVRDRAGRNALSSAGRFWLGTFAVGLLAAVATIVALVHG